MSLPVRLRRAAQNEYDQAADWYESRGQDWECDSWQRSSRLSKPSRISPIGILKFGRASARHPYQVGRTTYTIRYTMTM
jgi:hypothetical protein